MERPPAEPARRRLLAALLLVVVIAAVTAVALRGPDTVTDADTVTGAAMPSDTGGLPDDARADAGPAGSGDADPAPGVEDDVQQPRAPDGRADWCADGWPVAASVRAADLPEGWASVGVTPPVGGAVSLAAFGDRLLVLTGSGAPSAGTSQAFVFDPLDVWSCLPPAPVSAYEAVIAATPDRATVVARGSAARFDVAQDGWVELAAPPGGTPLAMAHTAHGLRALGREGTSPGQGVVYRPEGRSWIAQSREDLPALLAAVAWSDHHRLAVLGDGSGRAFDLRIGEWVGLADNGLYDRAVAAAWYGDRLFAYDYTLRAGFYVGGDPDWHPLPDPPFEPAECYPELIAMATGHLFAFYCGQAALLDTRTDTWQELATPDWEARYGPSGMLPAAPVAVGDQAFVLEPLADGDHRLWRYTP